MNKFIVLAGSRIYVTIRNQNQINEYRDAINHENLLTRDLEFSFSTTAARFVSGGLMRDQAWFSEQGVSFEAFCENGNSISAPQVCVRSCNPPESDHSELVKSESCEACEAPVLSPGIEDISFDNITDTISTPDLPNSEDYCTGISSLESEMTNLGLARVRALLCYNGAVQALLEQHVNKALSLFQQSAQLGNADALCMLALFGDLSVIPDALEQAAELKQPTAMCLKGAQMLKCDGDFSGAESLVKHASRIGIQTSDEPQLWNLREFDNLLLEFSDNDCDVGDIDESDEFDELDDEFDDEFDGLDETDSEIFDEWSDGLDDTDELKTIVDVDVDNVIDEPECEAQCGEKMFNSLLTDVTISEQTSIWDADLNDDSWDELDKSSVNVIAEHKNFIWDDDFLWDDDVALDSEVLDAQQTFSGEISANVFDPSRAHLVTDNLKMVWRIVMRSYMNRIEGTILSYNDLYQEGCIGLMRAAMAFDPVKGKFATYAYYWIHQSIQRAILNVCTPVRIPVHVFEKIRLYRKAVLRLEKQLNRLPNATEIAIEMNLTEAAVKKLAILDHYTDAQQDIFASDADDDDVSDLTIKQESRCLMERYDPECFEEETPGVDEFIYYTQVFGAPLEAPAYILADTFEDTRTPSPDAIYDQQELAERVQRELLHLPDKSQNIIRKRFGIGEERDYTLEEIGQMYELTRERIRQIERNALERLAHPCRSKNLREFWNF